MDFLIGMFSINCFFWLGYLPSTNGSRRRAVDARGGKRAGSGSHEEEEEATGSDREDL